MPDTPLHPDQRISMCPFCGHGTRSYEGTSTNERCRECDRFKQTHKPDLSYHGRER